MKNLHFSIHIKAPVKKVWDVMLDDKTYREWTAPFSEGGYYEGSWDEGSKIRFLGPEKNGTLSGMISEIAENRPHEFISIRHLGIIKEGVEDMISDEVKQWAGARENYTFHEVNGETDLDIDILSNGSEETEETKQMADMFEDMWPKALQKLKELAEA